MFSSWRSSNKHYEHTSVAIVKSCLLNSVNVRMFPAGIHKSQSGIVSHVVVGHVELLELCVLLELLSQLQSRLVAHPSVHQRQVRQRLVLRQGLQQGADSRVQQSIVTQAGEDINRINQFSSVYGDTNWGTSNRLMVF